MRDFRKTDPDWLASQVQSTLPSPGPRVNRENELGSGQFSLGVEPGIRPAGLNWPEASNVVTPFVEE